MLVIYLYTYFLFFNSLSSCRQNIFNVIYIYQFYLSTYVLTSPICPTQSLNAQYFDPQSSFLPNPIYIISLPKVIKRAELSLVKKEEILKGFIFDWEDAEARRRKKKLRIARVQKTDEEIVFENGMFLRRLYH